jgi:hypothetical protein
MTSVMEMAPAPQEDGVKPAEDPGESNRKPLQEILMNTSNSIRSLTVATLLCAAFAAHATSSQNGCGQPAPQGPSRTTMSECRLTATPMVNPQPLPPEHGSKQR